MAWAQRVRYLLALSATAGLVACGGGSDDSPAPAPAPTPSAPAPAPSPSPAPAPAPTPAPAPAPAPTPAPSPAPAPTALSGTAAVGAPIVGGTVQAVCSGGGTLPTAITGPGGTWTISATGQSLPCAVKISGGNLAAGQALYSVAISFDTVNITPLTDLLVANLTGQAPAQWWGASGPANLSNVTIANIDQALAKLRAALGLAVLNTINPVTQPFTAAAKDPIDDILEALKLALANLGMSYATLLNAAATPVFTPPAGFQAALASAHVTVTAPPSAGGSYTLTLDIVASGISVAPVTINNVPKPATQAEFCDDLTNASSSGSLTQAIPSGTGTLVINNCSFNGTVGHVSATLQIASPISMTVPYTVTYTYH
ncbi:hypothetical protein PY257_13510 [Ramlibacter sp. H39-3-26]|uniref:hypothetical protein n=1 Tax=Curvibacter soli TaxID=3031331 RepID=UPI0023DB71C7|nr:hypothetical protein [Ramlibacter sp. H39-3-26]MDF1486186.1 hypothetical protein [Ramlibacter sp. H39-3-26]